MLLLIFLIKQIINSEKKSKKNGIFQEEAFVFNNFRVTIENNSNLSRTLYFYKADNQFELL